MTRSDRPQRSDVLLILGGDYQTRVPAAARLFHEGYAPKVMLLREPTAPEMVLQHRPSFTQISLEMRQAYPKQELSFLRRDRASERRAMRQEPSHSTGVFIQSHGFSS